MSTAYVIMLNDTPVAVVLDNEEFAENQRQEQKRKHRESPVYHANAPEFWHIKEVPYY